MTTPRALDLTGRPEVPVVRMTCDLCGVDDPSPVAEGVDWDYATCANRFTFVRCRRCSLVYLDPRPANEVLEVIYPPEYEPFHFHESANPFIRHGRAFVQRRKAAVLQRLLGDEADIMDVGTGTAQLLALLQRHGPPGWRLWGNDFSPEALRNVEALGLPTVPGRFEELRTELRFDALLLIQAIEHFESPSSVVQQAHELLRPGGNLVVETPSLDGLDARLFRRGRWGGYHLPRHWALFDAVTLRTLLERHGFDVVELRYLASPAFWCQSVNHLAIDRHLPAPHFWSLHNPVTLGFFTVLDLALAPAGRPTSNLRVVARRGPSAQQLPPR